ncbi:hypothetical protein LCGC14_0412490 [marine sediment metagenome]|uniref:Uncharacterized protein n=1 Tax=marine sediment metagenome TaxID=412755 RepID=A0A0F9W2N3_9ZZZZ
MQVSVDLLFTIAASLVVIATVSVANLVILLLDRSKCQQRIRLMDQDLSETADSRPELAEEFSPLTATPVEPHQAELKAVVFTPSDQDLRQREEREAETRASDTG